jgi:hypothetical protein
MAECCQLVGNLQITGIDACLFSINYSSSTEMTRIEDCTIIGPTIGNISITGPATEGFYSGCPAKAGVSIPWVRKFDCDNNDVHFIFAGQGKAYVSGEDAPPNVTLLEPIRSYSVLSADSGSGPASIYTKTTQIDGYGLRFTGTPIPFETSEAGVVHENIGIGTGPMYLQNFSVTYSPGAIPVASYSFVFKMTEED